MQKELPCALCPLQPHGMEEGNTCPITNHPPPQQAGRASMDQERTVPPWCRASVDTRLSLCVDTAGNWPEGKPPALDCASQDDIKGAMKGAAWVTLNLVQGPRGGAKIAGQREAEAGAELLGILGNRAGQTYGGQGHADTGQHRSRLASRVTATARVQHMKRLPPEWLPFTRVSLLLSNTGGSSA